MKFDKDALVLYKQSPAKVQSVGDKIDILLPGGKSRSVREKDVVLLHPGPTRSFPDLESNIGQGNPQEAWELLLDEENPSIEDIAELAWGEFSPESAWMAFKLLNRSPWFRGTPDAIEVATAQEVEERQSADREKADAEAKWEDFLQRFRKKAVNPQADEPFLRDLEMYALGRSKGSRILKALGKTQSPENAHRTLLAYGVVDESWNPAPLRLDLPLEAPDLPLPNLPEEDRRDMTSLEAFAIDDEGNQDPDDAISWDGRRLWVHVADAAALITPGSELDALARERASSLYLPEKTVPMLPPQAAERLGLGLADTSPALSYGMRLDDDGRPCDLEIVLSTVKVTRLTYREADGMMAQEPFATMKGITHRFRGLREQAGAVSIRLPEVRTRVVDGQVEISPLPDLESRKMVTEAMLMAGSQAAHWCREKGLAVPYASQEGPDREDDNEVLPPPHENDYVAQFDLRRGMKRSRTTLECAPHAGLGLEAYCRVTSPLRRYPDLLASQQIRGALTGSGGVDEESAQKGMAAYESQVGSLVQGERKSNMYWKMVYLKRQPKWKGEAVMVDRRDRQGFFLIPELALETRVALKKEVALGGRVILRIREVDLAEATPLFLIDEVLS